MSMVIYYLIGVPLGWWLAFRDADGILGLWTGLGVAVPERTRCDSGGSNLLWHHCSSCFDV